MEIIPAIYILNGQTVALYKGSLEQKEVYRRTPLEFAQEFVSDGATSIYLIDLDASEYGSDRNVEILKGIRQKIKVPIMCAGGIRTLEAIKMLFDMGMDRLVLGVSAESVYKEAINQYRAEKIIVGIKAKGDEVLTDQKRKFPLRVIDFAENLPSIGVTTVLYKDVWKEGTQIGPNYDEVDRMLRMTPLGVYAAGGIGKTKHLKTLKEIGTKGAVIGKAFYERELYLKDCLDL